MTTSGKWLIEFKEILESKGYVVLRANYSWDKGKEQYAIKWSPRVAVPWLRHRYLTDWVTGPNPEVIKAKLESLRSLLPE